MGRHEPNLCGSGGRQEASSFTYGNEISGSNKFGRNQQLSKKVCVPWSYLRCGMCVHICQFAVLYRHEQNIHTFHCRFLAGTLRGQTHLAARVRRSPTWTADRPAAPAVPTSLQESLAKGHWPRKLQIWTANARISLLFRQRASDSSKTTLITGEVCAWEFNECEVRTPLLCLSNYRGFEVTVVVTVFCWVKLTCSLIYGYQYFRGNWL